MFAELVSKELTRARTIHTKNMVSRAEALGVILEEFEEFKAEVFKRHERKESLLSELVQLAAMCQRAAEDLKMV